MITHENTALALMNIQNGDNTLAPVNASWSHFQEAIFEFGTKHRKKNLVVQACAGSGKTSTLFELAKRMGGEILFLAFSKEIATYAKGKLERYPNIDVRTFHSFGMQLLAKHVGFYADLDSNKLSMFFNGLPEFDKRRFIHDDFYPKSFARKVVKYIRQLGMMSYNVEDIYDFVRETPKIFSVDKRKRAQEEAWVYSNIEQFPRWLREIDKLPLRPGKTSEGKKINTYKSVIDFDDMVRLPCIHNLAEKHLIKQRKSLIDESQDMNPYQIHLVTQLYKKNIRIICVGDRLQAIFSFRGSFIDSMDRMKAMTQSEELPLSVTYRCRKAIVDFVNARISNSRMIAHKEGGRVTNICKEDFVESVLDHDVRMIVGARNKSLLECWITLAKNKIASSLKGSRIVNEIRYIIEDIAPSSIEDLCDCLAEAVAEGVETTEDGEQNYKIPVAQIELMTAIPEIIEAYNIQTLHDLEMILRTMEQDAAREIHTVHSAKGLESSSVVVLGDWFECDQLENMQYVAYTRAEDTLILVDDWFKEKELESLQQNIDI